MSDERSTEQQVGKMAVGMNIKCKDRAPFKDTLMVQSGWTADGRKNMVEIQNAMSKSCHFDARKTEPGCDGCRWRDNDDTRDQRQA